MAMTLPAVPDLPAGHIVTEAEMDALTYACTFLLTKPMARVHDAAGTQVIGASATNIPFNTKDYDTDGMWSSGANTRLTVQTPGWYKFQYVISISSAGHVFNSQIKSTTGSNNPLGSGVTSGSHWAGYGVGSGTNIVGCGSSGIWPFYLYAGDFLFVSVTADVSGGTLETSGSQSFFSLEWVSI